VVERVKVIWERAPEVQVNEQWRFAGKQTRPPIPLRSAANYEKRGLMIVMQNYIREGEEQ
jgi:hypothetical protein